VSGHRNLSELQKYLEVTTEQVRGAVSSLSMLSHVGISKYTLHGHNLSFIKSLKP
jgi:integrase/recombinase XerD